MEETPKLQYLSGQISVKPCNKMHSGFTQKACSSESPKTFYSRWNGPRLPEVFAFLWKFSIATRDGRVMLSSEIRSVRDYIHTHATQRTKVFIEMIE